MTTAVRFDPRTALQAASDRHPRMPPPASPWRRLDFARIGAQSGTLALNGALLLALMAPLAAPPLLDAARHEPDVVFLDPPRPKPVEIVRPRDPEPPKRVAVVEARPRVQPVDVPPVVVDDPQPGDTFVHDPGPITDTVADLTPPSLPSSETVLQYRVAPPPPYPREALVQALTGTVMLQVLVDIDGRPIEVTVARSSGHRVLDQAARRQVLSRWRFVPAQQDGRAVQALGLVPVEFMLRR